MSNHSNQNKDSDKERKRIEKVKWPIKKIIPDGFLLVIILLFVTGYLLLILFLTLRDIQVADKTKTKFLEERIIRQINNSKIPINHVNSLYFVTSVEIPSRILPEGNGYVCLGSPYPSDMYKIGFALYNSLENSQKEKFSNLFDKFCKSNIINKNSKSLEKAYFLAEKTFAEREKDKFAIVYALYFSEGSEDYIKHLGMQIDKKQFQKEWQPFFDEISDEYQTITRSDLFFVHSDFRHFAYIFWLYAVNFPKAVFY